MSKGLKDVSNKIKGNCVKREKKYADSIYTMPL